MAESPFPAVLDLGSNGGSVQFESLDALRAWLAEEGQRWTWLPEIGQRSASLAPLVGVWKSTYKTMQVRVGEVAALTDQEAQNRRAAALLDEIKKHYDTGAILHSESDLGAAILQLKARDPAIAGAAFGALIKANFVPQGTKELEGFIEGVLLRKGINPDQVTQALQQQRELEQRWSEIVAAASKKATDTNKQLDAILIAAREATAAGNRQFGELMTHAQETFDSEIAAARKKLVDFERSISDKFSIGAPIEYWEAQEKRHWWASFWFGLAAIAVGISALVSLFLFSESLLASFGQVVGKLPQHVTFADIPLTLISSFVLGVLAFVWVERILVRILLSHVHLRMDAGERIVMAKTYLALLKESAGTEEEDRKLILTALFRHAASGIVTDDAAPPIWEIATRDRPK